MSPESKWFTLNQVLPIRIFVCLPPSLSWIKIPHNTGDVDDWIIINTNNPFEIEQVLFRWQKERTSCSVSCKTNETQFPSGCALQGWCMEPAFPTGGRDKWILLSFAQLKLSWSYSNLVFLTLSQLCCMSPARNMAHLLGQKDWKKIGR